MFGGILREFREILGKYRMLDVESVGSKGLSESSQDRVIMSQYNSSLIKQLGRCEDTTWYH